MTGTWSPRQEMTPHDRNLVPQTRDPTGQEPGPPDRRRPHRTRTWSPRQEKTPQDRNLVPQTGEDPT
ncbi:hypothetical protein NHX12_030107 [Muraenolepis orangiensis]|uniref:Uncharacterized protein n=1 Tax=Muraenolepis orangiensis TaxID=630683 RepID=A0A9Q0IKP0_9TELE|nr:hypothetical protein NHX12_030107 [Muraenolepis orangiensis]